MFIGGSFHRPMKLLKHIAVSYEHLGFIGHEITEKHVKKLSSQTLSVVHVKE